MTDKNADENRQMVNDRPLPLPSAKTMALAEKWVIEPSAIKRMALALASCKQK